MICLMRFLHRKGAELRLDGVGTEVRGDKLSTLPETNIAPKNGWLEYYFPIGMAHFQRRAVSFREGTIEQERCA